MKRMLAAVVVAGCTLVGTAGAWAQTVDELVEKHLAAMGGRAALAKITNQAATGTVTIATGELELSGTVSVWRLAPNKTHTRIELDLSSLGGASMVIDQICDGKTAVAKNSLQGDREITGDQLQGMLNAGFPSALLNYKDTGGQVELSGKEQVGGRAAHVLKYIPKAGPAVRFYLDAESFLIVKSVTKANIPEAGGEVEQTSELSDYRDVAGIKAPFSVRSVSPIQTLTIHLSKLEWNAALDDALFTRGAK